MKRQYRIFEVSKAGEFFKPQNYGKYPFSDNRELFPNDFDTEEEALQALGEGVEKYGAETFYEREFVVLPILKSFNEKSIPKNFTNRCVLICPDCGYKIQPEEYDELAI
jgi:hypothetical protein